MTTSVSIPPGIRLLAPGIRRVAGQIGLGLLATLSCAEPSGPSTHNHSRRLLIAGTEDGAIVVDLDWRGIVRRMGPRFVSHGPTVLDARNTLITVGRLQSDDQIMVGLDATSGLELWRVALASGTMPATVDGVELGSSMIAAHPTLSEVFLWRSTLDGVNGVAAYDYRQKQVRRFYGPMVGRFRAMAATPPTAEHPHGCLVVGADSGQAALARAYLHVACEDTFESREAINIDLPSRFVVQMQTSADGKDLLVMTDLAILKYDAATMGLKENASRPLAAPFFLTRFGSRLVIPDVGSSVVASSGIIYLLDASLELALVVDLRILPFGERPLGIMGAEESLDRRWLYILGGVPRDGPLYGPERTHVVVIDQASGQVADVVRLNTFGGGTPYLVP
ncbi:MAG TPA: hypothetical protein VF981_12270 [Gemmatimonadaceae bacterium]